MNGTFNYGGRKLGEKSPSSPAGWDNCYVPGQEQQGGPPPFTIVSGNNEILDGVNNYDAQGTFYVDSVGRGPDNIDWYRRHNRTPCGNQLYQQMWLSCDSGPVVYTQSNNILSAGIGTNPITSVRNGVETTTKWLTVSQKTAGVDAVTALLLSH